MNRIQKNNISNISNGIVKRVGICILCCLPIMVLIGFWLQDLNSVARIAIFTLFIGGFYGVLNKAPAYKKLLDNIVRKIKPMGKKFIFITKRSSTT